MDGCIEVNGSSVVTIPDHPVTKGFIDMKNRGVRITFIHTLDVTKIETQSLIFSKERLNLNDVVISATKDVKNQTQDRWGGGAQILYESKGDATIFYTSSQVPGCSACC